MSEHNVEECKKFPYCQGCMYYDCFDENCKVNRFFNVTAKVRS